MLLNPVLHLIEHNIQGGGIGPNNDGARVAWHQVTSDVQGICEHSLEPLTHMEGQHETYHLTADQYLFIVTYLQSKYTVYNTLGTPS